jgi:cold shock CspA family protein
LQETTVKTPVQIDFQNYAAVESQRSAIREHLAEIERMFGGIIAGRIVVEGSSKHHRTGGLIGINIRLKLPDGKEVDVSRTPDADERYSDFNFALGDAFRRAQRQLRDEVERMQREIKTGVQHPIGTVTKLFEDHGFLESADGLEIYFHKNSVLNRGFAKLRPGAKVNFIEEAGEKGPQASTVKLLGKHALR